MATAMEDSPPSDTQQSNKPTNQSSRIIMDKLKTSIIERLTKLNPNQTLSPSQVNSIQLQLQHAFPSFHIPTHPTYSTMIEKAIEVLNEEDGSSEEAISEYIMANYEDLPWAHNRFLSYYLDKLCKDGEVVCISSNRYSVPWLMDEFSKKKSFMMVHPMEVDNIDGNAKNVDVGLFQEDGEEAEVLVKFRVKRKRNSLAVQDDKEEEAGGTEIVEAHDNVVENSEVPVNDDENVSDGIVKAKGKNRTNDERQIAAVDMVQSVVAVEQGSQSVPSANLGDEVKAGGSSLSHDPCEGKSEPMVSTMDKAVPGEHEEELRREPLLSDHAISGTTLMLVPSVSIEKLTNEPMNGGPAVVSVSGVDSPKDTSDKLVLGRKDQDRCAADLKIVALEKGSPKYVENREIVLCLCVPQPEQLRRMFRPRNKSKQCQVGKSTTSATPTTASPDFTKGTKMRHVYRPRKKSNCFSQFDNEGLHDGFSTMAPDMKLDPKLSESSMSEKTVPSQQGHKSNVVEGSVEHEHGKQKLHSDSSPSSHKSELMFMEDEDLNLPLRQVLKMHGKWRKTSMHAKLSKLAPGSEDTVKKMPLKEKKMTRRKRKQKMLQYDGQKSDGSEAVAAPESEAFQPVQSPGGSSNDCDGHDGQALQIAYSTAAATPEKHAVAPPHDMQVQVTLDTFGFDVLHHKSRENAQIKGDHGLFHKSGQYDGIIPRESSQTEDKNALKDLKHPTEHPNLILEEAAPMVSPVFQEIMEEDNEGGIANSPVESPSVRPSSPSHHDLDSNDMNPRESSMFENENAWKNLKHPIEHHQQQERPSEPEEKAASMVLPVSQWKIPEEENDGGFVNPPLESLSVKSSSPSHLDLEEDPLKQNESDVQLQDLVPDMAISMKGKMPCSNQWSLHEKKEVKKRKRRGRPPKNENENGEESVYSHSLKQEGLSDTVSYQQSDPRNKQRKKDGRGRPRKIKETITKDIPAPLDLFDMLQKELEQAVVCQSENKDGENSSRQTEPVTQDVGAVGLHERQQDGVPLPANHFLEEKDEQGVPNEESDSTRNDATVLVNLHPQQKKVPSETTIFQPTGHGRRRKQEVVQCEPTTAIDEVAVISMHDQQQEGVSEQTTSESRKEEMTTEDMVAAPNFREQQHEKTCEPSTKQHKINRGKSTKQIGATDKDVATDKLDLQDQQQEGSSVQATHQMKNGRGRLPKSDVAEKSPLDQQQELPYKPAVHPSPDAFNVSCLPVHKLPATLEEPVSLRTRSKKGGAHKPEAAETLLGSEADHQGEELVPILLDEEFHQQEAVPKTDQEKTLWQSSSENPEESPSKSEQVTNCSDDESLLADQPCKLEGQRDSIGKQGQQLRSLTTVLKQKSYDHTPSAIRRSQRISQQQSQAGS